MWLKSGLTHAEFFKRLNNQWFLACLDLAKCLFESVKQTHIEEETNPYTRIVKVI
jgi:hypothetical protein